MFYYKSKMSQLSFIFLKASTVFWVLYLTVHSIYLNKCFNAFVSFFVVVVAKEFRSKVAHPGSHIKRSCTGVHSCLELERSVCKVSKFVVKGSWQASVQEELQGEVEKQRVEYWRNFDFTIVADSLTTTINYSDDYHISPTLSYLNKLFLTLLPVSRHICIHHVVTRRPPSG